MKNYDDVPQFGDADFTGQHEGRFYYEGAEVSVQEFCALLQLDTALALELVGTDLIKPN